MDSNTSIVTAILVGITTHFESCGEWPETLLMSQDTFDLFPKDMKIDGTPPQVVGINVAIAEETLPGFGETIH